MADIAVFTGSNTHFNVVRTVTNHGRMLADDFELHLVTTDPGAYPRSVLRDYDIYGGMFPSNHVGHGASLAAYLASQTPDVVVPPTRPVLYGALVTPFTFTGDFQYVYRHSGEIFRYHESLRGWKKLLCYAVRNLGGTMPLAAASAYVSLGPTGKQQLIKKGVDSEAITMLPPTIAPDRFEVDDTELPERLRTTERHVVLFLGRRTRMKGIHTIEAIIPSVLQQRDDLEFVFVGGGDRIPDVPARFQDNITVVGRVPPETVPAYLTTADVLVHPSLSEGVPRVLLEALFMDTPVLARRVGDIPTVTDNTFRTQAELVELLANFESLSVDPVDEFLLSNNKDKYVTFFDEICSRL